MPLGQKQGGGAGRRPVPGDICPKGIRTRRPRAFGDVRGPFDSGDQKKPAQWPAFFSFFAARFSFSVFSGFFFSSFFLSRFLAMTVSAGWVVDAAQMYEIGRASCRERVCQSV